MKTSSVTIVDYKVGNLFNVERACRHLGMTTEISDQPQVIARAKRLIIPGVGAFEAGMQHLKDLGLIEPIRALAQSGKPILGICLGMQILMTESEEHGLHTGLDLVPGRVVRFTAPDALGHSFKVPQIGWNSLLLSKTLKGENHILSGLGHEPYMYFLHSYRVIVRHPEHQIAETVYGKDRFASAIKKGAITACQFHPERSGELGLKILENFFRMN